ncbi:MAG: hypothetical protein A2846_02055 [Candidatus Doudnabacteria bacterium RIFCSPHIGHO2_01_FULL_49_9]|uniref:DUF8173 domain-containing protein n=1 Tax=Candidatus Doudnabacteria bacterium RIFCSPHIGHO2_01_FULL_49_9 TaxID=1817827 RepID=A0A1F5P3V0_9BACT|nr:MAG: hypothetical protein A2846_02055 [Candidatus Doudnabacteria bacterium RIFCSPHIGHO2_01_FULL_49_9]
MAKSQEKPWHNLGLGLVFAIVLPIIAILALVTVIGLYAGLILLAWLAFVFFMVGILEALLLGTVILKWLKKYDGLRWPALATGALALAVLSLVPVLGTLVCLVLGLISFGAMLSVVKERLASEQVSVNNQPDGTGEQN